MINTVYSFYNFSTRLYKIKMELKCGRETFNLNEKDVIMYNGACYQLITRKVDVGWKQSTPVVAKAKAKKLIKDGLLTSAVLENAPYKGEDIEYYMIAK